MTNPVNLHHYIYARFYVYIHICLLRNVHIHPKTLFEIAMVLSTNSGSFPSNSHVSATFSILLYMSTAYRPYAAEYIYMYVSWQRCVWFEKKKRFEIWDLRQHTCYVIAMKTQGTLMGCDNGIGGFHEKFPPPPPFDTPGL